MTYDVDFSKKCMRPGEGVKNRQKFADVLYGWPLYYIKIVNSAFQSSSCGWG